MSAPTLQKYINYILFFVLFTLLVAAGFCQYDYGDYTGQIKSLINHGSLINANGRLIDRYPPLNALIYYLFYLLSFKNIAFAFYLLHLLLGFLVLFLFHRLLQFFHYNQGRKLLLTLLELVVVINPFIGSFFLRGANSELIFICLTLGGVLALLQYLKTNKMSYLIIVSLTIGASFLSRSQAIAFLISVICILLYQYRTKALKPVLLMIAIVALMILPWQLSVNHYAKHPSFISSGGLPSFRDGMTFNHKDFRDKIWLPDKVEKFSAAFYHEFYETPKQDRSTTEVAFTIQYMQEHPMAFAELMSFKFIRAFYGTDSQNNKYELVNALLILVLLALFIISVLKYRSGQVLFFRLYLGWFFLYAALTVMMTMAALAILRYQVPLMPFLFVCILLYCEQLLRKASLLNGNAELKEATLN